jgi:hypothetical protein
MRYAMRLKHNKEDIIDSKVRNMIFWKERNIMDSNGDIFNKQDIGIYRLINSNTLIHNIYNEINRE